MFNPVKRTFLRFFFKSRLFSDGYQPVEGAGTPIHSEVPDFEVKSRDPRELGLVIPDGAVGFVYFDIITAGVEDGSRMVELTSGEINCSGRYFFQYSRGYGRVASRDEALQEYNRHTYMRRYCRKPIPERIILFPGGRTAFCANPVCTFDFLETDTLVPVRRDFMRQGYIVKPAEKAA